MKHEIPHDLDAATAKKVTDKAFDAYKARFPEYSPNLTWASDRRAEVSFHALGKSLNGSMEIADKTITLDLDVPFLMRPFQGKAVEVIDREVKKWIGKAKAGEL